MTNINWTNITVRLGDLKAWPDNPRQSTKAQAKKLLQSFDEFGQVETIAVSPELEVYNGHQRLSALMTIHGKDYQIDARQASRALTEQERKKLTIFLHAGATGSWDWDTLSGWDASEIISWGLDDTTLKEWKHDISGLGEMLKSEKQEPVDAEPQIDKAEELRAKWGVESGQLWQIGDHRLLCGDCTKREDVERVMAGEKAELAPVDPPYNVGFDYDGETVDDTKTGVIYEAFSKTWFGECQRVSERQIVTPGCNNLASWLRWFDAFHWAPWTKSNSMTNGKVSHFWCWEPVLFFGEKWKRTRTNDLFDFPIGMQKDVANHPCPKPLKMWNDIIENYSEPEAIIFESFAGSGTTMVACQNLNRKCRAIEISPAYCAVILERMSTAFPEIKIEQL